MNEKRNEKNLQALMEDDDQVHNFKNKNTLLTAMLIIMVMIVALLITGFIYMFIDVEHVHTEYGMTKQLIYNMTKTIEHKNRKSMITRDISVIIKRYRPAMSEHLADSLSKLIYKYAEQKYNIQSEEIAILVSLESDWYYRATSSVGAKGLGQLMPLTARWAASELGIDWEGDDTVYDTKKNLRMTIYFYNYLMQKFDYHREWCLAAYGGEENFSKLYKIYKTGKPLPKRYMKYYHKWLRKKTQIENILNKPINLM